MSAPDNGPAHEMANIRRSVRDLERGQVEIARAIAAMRDAQVDAAHAAIDCRGILVALILSIGIAMFFAFLIWGMP